MTVNLVASVHARLLSKAKERREEFQRTLVRFAIERFLYRLGQTEASSRYILKGAALLSVWMADPYRTTRDIDLLASGSDDDATIRSIIEEACSVASPEDALSFDLRGLSIEPIRNEEAYSGKRIKFDAYLGKALIPVQIDIGFGDAMTEEPVVVEYPTMLEGIPAPRIRTYRRETSISEKFEAAVKLGTTNSRMKDFHDLWALSGDFAFEGAALRNAIEACFARRGRAWSVEVPECLTAEFYADLQMQAKWEGYVRKSSRSHPPPARFNEIGERVIGFLAPVRMSILNRAPFASSWESAGPWRSTES